MELQFAVQSYAHDSLPLSAQRTINAYAEAQPKDAKSRVAVFGSPGLSQFANVGTGPIRGGMEMLGVTYVVSGSEFYSVNSSGAGTLRGTNITGINPVSMDGTGIEIVIVNGVNGFSFLVATNDFVQIPDADLDPASTVTVINNIFVLDKLGTNQFQISNTLDGRTYDDEFASAESNPDYVKAVQNRNGILIVLGTKTVEFWDHTGSSDFPFTRFKGGTLDHGLRGIHAFSVQDQRLFMLCEDLVFREMAGQSLIKRSTPALEAEWQKYATTSDAFCFPVSIRGHVFIHLTFPAENRTFVYDIATTTWHERMSFDPGGNEIRWRGSCCVPCYDKVLIGDANSGRIGVCDPAVYTEFGDPIITTLISPPIYFGGRLFFMPELEIDMETGVGLSTGQGSDPQVMMTFSDDGGRTYGEPEQWRSMGQIGKYETRIRWDRLGSSHHRVIKLSISDPVKRVITGARAPGLDAETR